MSLPNRSIRIDPAHSDILNAMLSLLRAGRADEARKALEAAAHDSGAVGPFRDSAAAQGFLIGRMVAASHPVAIWLFGSRARNEERPESDFDFLVVVSDAAAAEIDDLRDRIADSVMGSGVGVDIAVCTEGEFDACKDMAGSLIRTVHEQGREVYLSRSARKNRHAAAA